MTGARTGGVVGSGVETNTYVPCVVITVAPQHRNELQVFREAWIHVGVPVIRPVYLRASTIVLMDEFRWVIEWETSFGPVACRDKRKETEKESEYGAEVE
jgi:hypothetical protein